MKKIINPKIEDWNIIQQRPTQSLAAIEDTVQQIFNEIQQRGDKTIKKYTTFFDGVSLDNLIVSQKEIATAVKQVSPELKQAIQIAKNNIYKFHVAQQTDKITVETMEGVTCWQEKRAVEKVGLYIPGGTAPLFSTILMLAVPAKIAGCKEIVLCTPPDTNGNIAPEILYTAQLCGVTNIYKAGGIQAIGAMTFGTTTIPQVHKIFGPGNQYVTVAKQIASTYGVAIDMPAGPSELLIYADATANASFVASDLLSQAEHGIDSQVILVTNSQKLLKEVIHEITLQLSILPRKDIAAKAMENSKLIVIDDTEKALEFINQYAPEHFILISEDENFFLNNIRNAGSVFIGNYTPESAGDYASGTNHTLPTNGYAKQYSGVHLDSFMKAITFQKISEKGILNLGPTIEIMATAEGLHAHKNAVTLRLKSLKK